MKFNTEQNGFEKNRSTSGNLFKLFETIKYSFLKGHSTTRIFIDVEEGFGQAWFDGLFLS